MTRKYQHIIRSTSDFLEMKEEDIFNLQGQKKPSIDLFVRHITSPLTKTPRQLPRINSCDVYFVTRDVVTAK